MNRRMRSRAIEHSVKEIALVMTGVVGIGLLLDAIGRPDTVAYAFILIGAALVWGNLALKHRAQMREERVRRAFGVSEAELRSMFLLTSDQITMLLEDGREMMAFSARVAAATRAFAEREGGPATRLPAA